MYKKSNHFFIFISIIQIALNRIPPNKRLFRSEIVEEFLQRFESRLLSQELKKTFENCFPNTLDTTVYFTNNSLSNRPDTFIITGDIKAQWLRDSTNQIQPYLKFLRKDQKIKEMIQGLINRQAEYINMDPYANAFNYNQTGSPHYSDDTYKIIDGKQVNAMNNKFLWERKYEIDSLAAFLKLLNDYLYEIDNINHMIDEWVKALKNILNLINEQQMGTEDEKKKNQYPFYSFQRNSKQPSESKQYGKGFPARRCGLVKSSFRPSDDSCILPFFIPGNAMLSVNLKKIGNFMLQKKFEIELAETLYQKGEEIEQAIYKYGIIEDQHNGEQYFAYEVDGYGNKLFMDDANIPSLLSLPYLGFIQNDNQIYLNTRKRVLSKLTNPFFYQGEFSKDGKQYSIQGVGSPHTGEDYIWPLSIIMRGMTAQKNQIDEIQECLDNLITTTAGTNFMHESFNKSDPNQFTRQHFAWANSLFGEFVVKIFQ